MVCEVVFLGIFFFFPPFPLPSTFCTEYFNFDFGSLEGEEKNNNTVNSRDDFLRASKKTVKSGKLTYFFL